MPCHMWTDVANRNRAFIREAMDLLQTAMGLLGEKNTATSAAKAEAADSLLNRALYLLNWDDVRGALDAEAIPAQVSGRRKPKEGTA